MDLRQITETYTVPPNSSPPTWQRSQTRASPP